MALDVKVNIKLAEIIGKAGAWFPCLYVVNSELEADAYDEYSSLEELVDTTSDKTTYTSTTDVYAAANIMFMQDNAPEKIAVLSQSAFSAEAMASHLTKGWRQLVLVGAHSDIESIATYIETTDKMLFATVSSKESLGTLYTKVKSFDRTFIVYHTDSKAVAAVVGATAGLNAGGFTYKNMKIKGIEALDLTASEIDEIHKNGAITIVEKVGDVVTSDGIVASGEFADIIDSKDYIIQHLSYRIQKVFNNNPKVPYTNNGIAMLETATFEILKDAYNNGMIADNDDGTPAYSTSFALRSETSEANRAIRYYPYGKFTFALAGAIHTALIEGVITV